MNTPTRTAPLQEKGASLAVALVALLIMSLAGIALIRAVDTTNLIAGNFAFKQAAQSAADIGIEDALTLLNGTIGPASDSNLPTGCASATPNSTCRYSTTARPLDTRNDIENNINWTNTANIPVNCVSGTTSSCDDGYRVQFVIDRLCKSGTTLGPDPTVDAAGPNCYMEPVVDTSSKKATGGYGGGSVSSSQVDVYYRVTVHVAGPRNTTTVSQSLLARRNH